MSLEFRDWNGIRMTYLCGKKEPIWLVAELTKKLGHIPRAARRLRWNRQEVRIALYHAEWYAATMAQERESALQAGFKADGLMNSPKALVVPGSALRARPQRPAAIGLPELRFHKKTNEGALCTVASGKMHPSYTES